MAEKTIENEEPTIDAGMMPIRIADVAIMLRRAISKNERPYTQAMFLHNNEMVDEWYDKVLIKIADGRGMIRAGQAWGEWCFFQTGKIISQFIEGLNNGYIHRPDSKTVDWWVKNFNEKSIRELAMIGPWFVGNGWKVIIDETYIRNMIAKWEKIYSLTDDPLKWRKLALDNPKLWDMDHESPFWEREEYKDLAEKIYAVTKIVVSPQ
jgi:hypothetical protein